MCPKNCDPCENLPTRMTILRESGAQSARQSGMHEHVWPGSATAGENFNQLLWWNHFQLSIGAVARFLVGAPSSKLRRVTEAGALHMLISNFHHELGPQWLPGQVLALTPAALASRHPMPGVAAFRSVLCPEFPGMIGQRVAAIRREVFYQLTALLFSETRADSNVVQRPRTVEKAQQQRANGGVPAVLVPSK